MLRVMLLVLVVSGSALAGNVTVVTKEYDTPTGAPGVSVHAVEVTKTGSVGGAPPAPFSVDTAFYVHDSVSGGNYKYRTKMDLYNPQTGDWDTTDSKDEDDFQAQGWDKFPQWLKDALKAAMLDSDNDGVPDVFDVSPAPVTGGAPATQPGESSVTQEGGVMNDAHSHSVSGTRYTFTTGGRTGQWAWIGYNATHSCSGTITDVWMFGTWAGGSYAYYPPGNGGSDHGYSWAVEQIEAFLAVGGATTLAQKIGDNGVTKPPSTPGAPVPYPPPSDPNPPTTQPRPDSDGDGWPDDAEWSSGSDPNDPASTPQTSITPPPVNFGGGPATVPSTVGAGMGGGTTTGTVGGGADSNWGGAGPGNGDNNGGVGSPGSAATQPSTQPTTQNTTPRAGSTGGTYAMYLAASQELKAACARITPKVSATVGDSATFSGGTLVLPFGISLDITLGSGSLANLAENVRPGIRDAILAIVILGVIAGYARMLRQY